MIITTQIAHFLAPIDIMVVVIIIRSAFHGEKTHQTNGCSSVSIKQHWTWICYMKVVEMYWNCLLHVLYLGWNSASEACAVTCRTLLVHSSCEDRCCIHLCKLQSLPLTTWLVDTAAHRGKSQSALASSRFFRLAPAHPALKLRIGMG